MTTDANDPLSHIVSACLSLWFTFQWTSIIIIVIIIFIIIIIITIIIIIIIIIIINTW